MRNIRLSQEDQDNIIFFFKKYYSQTSEHLWIFGSRVDLAKKGGDIDLYIETIEPDIHVVQKQKNNFLDALHDAIGYQKIDIIINMLKSTYLELPIYKIAKETGIQLV